MSSLLAASAEANGFLATPLCSAVKDVVAQAQTNRLSSGARLNHYEVLAKLGSGGMGKVYLAMDTQLRRQIALKVLAPDMTYDARAFERFEREARAASALNHPNILTIFEFGQADGLHYMASEYIEGPTLRQSLHEGKLGLQPAIHIAIQIASALAAAHNSGIIHRDIKPENIIVRSDGLAKLLDFGIAKLGEARPEEPTVGNGTARPLGETQAGMVMGTVRYMSPEQAQGLAIDARSNLFSLGAVMYEMLAGVPPFEGESKDEVIAEILTMDPPPLADFTADVPPELEHMVCKAMRKEPEARYQTARDLLMDLQQLQKRREFEANLQRAGYVEGGYRRSRPTTGGLRTAPGQGGVAEGKQGGATDGAGSAPRPRGVTAGWMMAMCCLAAFAVFLLWLRFGWRHAPAPPETAATPRSLAVLPFRNLKQDPGTDFFQFSLADAIITKLGYVKALTVRSSSSIDMYRDTNLDPRKVAAQLHVDMLLTGAFIKEGNDLRITSQLIDVKPDTIVWRDTMDVTYDKLLTVQDRVAEQIIRGLSLKLSPEETERIRFEKPANTTAYEYYLRGVDLYSLNEFGEAIAMLQKSLALEPDYALAWAQLGRAYTTHASLQFGGRDQYAKAQAAYEKALALDPGILEARVYMANMLTDTGRVEQAVPLLREALQTNPSNAEAHWEPGYAYRFGGMLNNSVTEAEEARRLDPEVKINSSAINSYLYLGEYKKFLDRLPASHSVYMLFYRGLAEYYLNDSSQAQRYFDQAYGLDRTLLPSPIGEALSLGLQHRGREALDLLHRTEARVNQQGVRDPEMIYKIAQAYAVLGDTPGGLRVLQQSIDGGFFCYPYFATDSLLKNLRENARFKTLLAEAQERHEQFQRRFSASHAAGSP